MNTKTCSICNEEKSIAEFYHQNKYSKKRGNYKYYPPYCKKCDVEKASNWIKNNYERFRENDRRYDKTEKGKITTAKKIKRQKESGYAKEYQKNNLDKFRLYNQERKSKINNLKSDFSIEDWENCLKHFDYCCAYCGKTQEENIKEHNKRLDQEHVIALDNDGTYTKDNIIPSCRNCNSSKNNKDFKKWYSEQTFYSSDKENKILVYLSSFK